ncbi:MAG TPA: hypothetical protein VIV11_35425 [Kofleriaceae bacterium]
MRFLALTLCLTACASDIRQSGDDDDQQDPDEVSPTAVYLTPPQHLTRISLALRGMRPALDDLHAVEADPAVLPSIVDRYLDSPAFAETIKELHNETLLMRIEVPQFTYPAIGPLAGKTARELNTGKFDEPLRLIEDIVMTDQPYTKIVTADYTMTNDVTAAMWGMTHTGAPEAWTRSALPDARPKLGILSSNALYDRWRSAGFNFNRGRANMISRVLLCHDYLTSDIMVDTNVDLADPDVVANAVIANKSCAGCHQTLDPLASYLFTYRNQLGPVAVDAYPVTYYSPATANRWMTANKRPPMFFGVSTGNMQGLGQAIADDPRFAKCAATRFASYFTEVAQTEVSGAWVARLQKALVDSNWNAKELAKAVMLSDEFRVSHDTDAEVAERTVGALKLRPEQLHRMIRDLTGFNWSTTATSNLRGIPYGTANLLESDFIGFRVLAGGIDSYFVTDYVHTMNATSSLVAKSAAAAAADFVVERDLIAAVADRTLFREAGVNDTDPNLIRAQLAYLHARIYGELVAPDSPEVDDTLVLYEEAFAASNNRARAWKVTLIGMLSNFRALFY